MKKSALTYFFLLMTTLLFSQELKISVAPTISDVNFYNYVIGASFGQPRFGINSNIDYLFVTNKRVEYGIGLGFQNCHVYLMTPSPSFNDYSAATEGVNILSINLRSVYNLKKDFYITIVPSLDLQVKPNDLQKINNQTGLGLSFGIGKNIKLNESLSFNIEPRLWIHNLIPLESVNHPYRLTTAAINLGLVFGQKND